MSGCCDARVVGAVLLALIPLVIIESVGSIRGGFGGRFWSLPVDEKLDHIAEHAREWRLVGWIWVPYLAVATGGLTAFALLLVGVGESVLAGLGLGIFLLGAVSWLIGVTIQAPGGALAARRRRETGGTPSWLEPLWGIAGWTEITWIVLADLAFVAWGVAMVRKGFPAVWAGWTSIAVGVVVVVGVLAVRRGFPHLGLLPAVPLAIALLMV